MIEYGFAMTLWTHGGMGKEKKRGMRVGLVKAIIVHLSYSSSKYLLFVSFGV